MLLNRTWTMFQTRAHQRTASRWQTRVRTPPLSENQAPLYAVGTTSGGKQVEEAGLVHTALPTRLR